MAKNGALRCVDVSDVPRNLSVKFAVIKLAAPGSPPPTQFGQKIRPENDRFLLVSCVGMFLEVADVETPDFWPKFRSVRAAAAATSARGGQPGTSGFRATGFKLHFVRIVVPILTMRVLHITPRPKMAASVRYVVPYDLPDELEEGVWSR
jgi:hypothetical protein